MDDPTADKPRREKFKHTRELIKIALDDGMTQEDIARLCRTQQSVVSGWKKGTSKALVQQIEPLLQRYGARLRRTTARVYLLAQARDKRGNPTGPAFRVHVVEGPVMFRYTSSRPALRSNGRNFSLGRDPDWRLLVHELPGPSFVVVQQDRRTVPADDMLAELSRTLKGVEQLMRETRDAFETLIRNQHALRGWVETGEEAARWQSTVAPPRTLAELLAWVDSSEFEPKYEAITVRFSLRKALLEHGHAVPGVERTPATP